MGRYLSGKFNPTNPEKYIGKITDIVFRSSWELDAFKFMDSMPEIVKWSSETIIIPYRGVDGLMHRYFMDLVVYAQQPDGKLKKFLIEIKPKQKLEPPKKTPAKSPENFRREMLEYLTNQAKWDAARAWCKQNNAEFKIWTEDIILPSKIKRVSSFKSLKAPMKKTKPQQARPKG